MIFVKVDNALAVAKTFFLLSKDTKKKYSRPDFNGYVGLDQEG